MMSRKVQEFRRALAENALFSTTGYTVVSAKANVIGARHAVSSRTCRSPHTKTSSLHGQQQCPNRLLSVVFSLCRDLQSFGVRERFSVVRVGPTKPVEERKLECLFRKLHWLQWPARRLQPAATASANRRWAAVSSALVQRPPQAAASAKGRQSERAQTLLRAKQTSLTATDIFSGGKAALRSLENHAGQHALRGFLRFNNTPLQKGPANVQ